MPGELDREGVRRRVADGAQLLEVLDPEEYDLEHLPGAVNIPLPEVGRRAGELDRSRSVVVYCFDSA
jgi:rhodanese-related sulfurtransferase